MPPTSVLSLIRHRQRPPPTASIRQWRTSYLAVELQQWQRSALPILFLMELWRMGCVGHKGLHWQVAAVARSQRLARTRQAIAAAATLQQRAVYRGFVAATQTLAVVSQQGMLLWRTRCKVVSAPAVMLQQRVVCAPAGVSSQPIAPVALTLQEGRCEGPAAAEPSVPILPVELAPP